MSWANQTVISAEWTNQLYNFLSLTLSEECKYLPELSKTSQHLDLALTNTEYKNWTTKKNNLREQWAWASVNPLIPSWQPGCPDSWQWICYRERMVDITIIFWFSSILLFLYSIKCNLYLHCNISTLLYHPSKSKSCIASTNLKKVNLVLNMKSSTCVIPKRSCSHNIRL